LADGYTNEVKLSHTLANIEHDYGSPWFFFHRVDLHNELKKLAFDTPGEGPPAILRLGCKVASVDAATASLTLSDGSIIKSDVVIGADGIHVRHHPLLVFIVCC
jgi:salicylate hydroxylase